jgi:hypothetical protein
MRRAAWLLGLVLAVCSAGGCVERQFTVYTDPPNALVLVNNTPLGPSPADGSFVYYGKYDFTLMAPGYETLHVREDIVSPWYEWFPFDFFFETLWPFEVKDAHTFHYHMVPMTVPNTEDVLRRSGTVRDQGRAIRPTPVAPDSAAATQTTTAPTQGAVPPTQMPAEGDR